MSAMFSLPMLWGQGFLPGVNERYRLLVTWLYIFGEPMANTYGTSLWQSIQSGLILWVKVLSLFCLFGWVLSWLTTALKERTGRRASWLDVAALGSIVGALGTLLMHQLEESHRIPVYKIAGTGIYVVSLLTAICVLIMFVWVEAALWSTIKKVGRRSDLLVLVGLHLALVLGFAVAFEIRHAANLVAAGTTLTKMAWTDAVVIGARIGGTYMGYVVLFRVVLNVLGELFAVRFRRLYSIAHLSVIEATRRMWAPWVVIAVFLVVLAFTHWFLQPPRPAEMGRLFVGTLTLLCSLLLTVMVTLLTPLSLPQDIQGQTIYTVVSKPVRRIELIWGRMLGFMAIVTVLMFVFGGISLAYLSRTVGGAITATEQAAIKRAKQNDMREARQLRDQAEQIRTRMKARVPIYGSLTFLDSKGTKHFRGIDVGTEQGSTREPRSHIEGATPATAIWTFGIVHDPLSSQDARPRFLDRRIPVNLLLRPGTVEYLNDQLYDLKMRIALGEQRQSEGNVAASKAKDLVAALARDKAEYQRVSEELAKKTQEADAADAKADAADKAGQADAQALRRQASALHSPDVPIEMTFNIYRTTKGRIGEPVYAEMEVTNPNLPNIPNVNPWRNIFPIREYYTNKQAIPAMLLAGTGRADPGREALRIEVRCISATQYLGMAQSDLFLLTESGDFGANFMKGLFGVWLQAMVLTAIGVFAGTFLSWPVALLTTISFFVAGQVAFSFLLEFAGQSMVGGGPFESLIRLLSHDNQMTELSPTLIVVTAKTFDALVMPVMSRLVFIVPNFSALDVSNTVADGFAVSWTLLGINTLMALAYALPFSIAGYFILKNREVAA